MIAPDLMIEYPFVKLPYELAVRSKIYYSKQLLKILKKWSKKKLAIF